MFPITAAIGIDISNKHVRVALIERRGSNVILRSLHCVARKGAGLEAVLTRIKKELTKATRLPWFFFSHQIMGIPQSSVAIKRFPAIEGQSDHEQYMQTGLHLSDSLGLPLDELLYDYRHVDDTGGIEAIACRRSKIENTLISLETSGFNLSVIELQTHALMRLFQQHLNHNTVIGASILIDIGVERVQMCINDGGTGLFHRELPLPMEGQCPSNQQERHRFTEQLTDGILRQYQLASSTLSNKKMKNVWLSGEGVKYVDIFLMEQKIGWNVEILNPLLGLSYSSGLIENSFESVGAWSIAIGLALRDIQ